MINFQNTTFRRNTYGYPLRFYFDYKPAAGGSKEPGREQLSFKSAPVISIRLSMYAFDDWKIDATMEDAKREDSWVSIQQYPDNLPLKFMCILRKSKENGAEDAYHDYENVKKYAYLKR